MNDKKSIWTTLTGGLSSTVPILISCCKSGACVGVCASPIASLFGISTAAIAGSPWMNVIEPVLIAISAVSFTISYYSLYIIPKYTTCGPNDCACEPTNAEKRKDKLNKFIFWFGLTVSILVLSYFEYSKFKSHASQASCETTCNPKSGDANATQACCSLESDTTEACCSGDDSTTCEH